MLQIASEVLSYIAGKWKHLIRNGQGLGNGLLLLQKRLKKQHNFTVWQQVCKVFGEESLSATSIIFVLMF